MLRIRRAGVVNLLPNLFHTTIPKMTVNTRELSSMMNPMSRIQPLFMESLVRKGMVGMIVVCTKIMLVTPAGLLFWVQDPPEILMSRCGVPKQCVPGKRWTCWNVKNSFYDSQDIYSVFIAYIFWKLIWKRWQRMNISKIEKTFCTKWKKLKFSIQSTDIVKKLFNSDHRHRQEIVLFRPLTSSRNRSLCYGRNREKIIKGMRQ